MNTNEIMQKEWEERAQTNAYHWVMSNKNSWEDQKDAYYKTGERHIQEYVLPFFTQKNIPKSEYKQFKMLDIGCGTGRITRALSSIGSYVTGIDISKEMIHKAKKDNVDIGNVTFTLGTGKGLQTLPDTSFDFCFSFIVFQHIPSKKIIHTYFSEIHRVLKKGGTAKFQVRGTPGDPPGKVLWFKGFHLFYIALCTWRGWLPILWLRKYDTVYGACFKQKELEKILKKTGFANVETYHENEKYLWAEIQK